MPLLKKLLGFPTSLPAPSEIKTLASRYPGFSGRSAPLLGMSAGKALTYIPIPGVYQILDESRQVIYVGQSVDIYRRMNDYEQQKGHRIWSHGAKYVQYEIIPDVQKRLDREKFLIRTHRPICNQQHNPGGRSGGTGLLAALLS